MSLARARADGGQWLVRGTITQGDLCVLDRVRLVSPSA